MIYISIDRIEESRAVCEYDDGNVVIIDLSLLPKGVKESDVLRYDNGSYFIDYDESKKRKKIVIDLIENIKNVNNEQS